MVQVSISATLSVQGGPQLPVGLELEPGSYSVSDADLDPAGGAAEAATLALLPDAGSVSVLAISCQGPDGSPATVTVTPSHGATDGDDLTVEGTLLIANAGVLEALVAGGPRAVTVTNTEATPTTVSVIACLDE